MPRDRREGPGARAGTDAGPGRCAADLVALLVGTTVAAAAVVRAVRVPVTHDEAYSFLRFVSAPAVEAWSFRRPDAANNHLLLTLVERLLVPLLGPSELALRLPVLLAWVAALGAAWIVLRTRCPPAVALGGFVVLASNRLLLELFSLARGYGLAIGLALCGLALLARDVEQGPRPLRTAAGLSLLVLSALAQVTLLDVWAAATLSFVAIALRSTLRRGGAAGTRAGGRVLASVAVPTALCAASAIPLALTMRRSGALYTGGRRGIFADTVGSIVRETLEPAAWAGPVAEPAAFAVGLVAVLVLAGVVVLALERWDPLEDGGTLLLGSTFVLSVAALEVQARLLGVPYPVDRVATPLVPLFLLAVCLLAGRFLRRAGPQPRAWANGVSLFVAVCAAAQFAATLDLSRSRLWWFDADSKAVLGHLDRLVAERRLAPGSVRVAASWILEPGLNYYRIIGGRTWMRPVDRAGLGGRRDFYVVASPDLASVEARGLSALKRFEAAGTLLAVAGPARQAASVPRLVAEGALADLAGVPAGGAETVSWIPVVVRAKGLEGAEWRSDLRIRNPLPSASAALVTVRSGQTLRQGAFGVPAGAEVTVVDVGGQLGLDGSAPLELRTREGVEATASVYDASTSRPQPADEGVWFRPVEAGDLLAAGSVGRLEGLEESNRARTNVALLNLGPAAVEVEIVFLGGQGRVLGGVRRVIQPEESVQESRPFAAFAGGAGLKEASARVEVKRGDGVVAWATVIDARTRAVRVVSAAR